MKPIVRLGVGETPDGKELALYRHDHDFIIRVDGQDLMQSRQHESELALARLGCAHLAGHMNTRILIGGLGMGYTLRATLDMVGSSAEVVVAETSRAVVKWNREFFGGMNGNVLGDGRVELVQGDVVPLIAAADSAFDAILLDVDNGPQAMTDAGNSRLYDYQGVRACSRALRKKGCLAVWSAAASKPFEWRLMGCRFHVRRYTVPAYKGSKSQVRFVWVASQNRANLPPGGGEPRPPPAAREQGRNVSPGNRGRPPRPGRRG